MLYRHKMIRLAKHNKVLSGKRGFTLIETMLAIVLLVLITVIMYKGFVTTMQLSINTSNFEQAGERASGQVNNDIAAATVDPLITPAVAIHVEAGAFEKDVGIQLYGADGNPDTGYGEAGNQEVGSFNSTNRKGFFFSG